MRCWDRLPVWLVARLEDWETRPWITSGFVFFCAFAVVGGGGGVGFTKKGGGRGNVFGVNADDGFCVCFSGPPTVPILGNEHQIPAADGHFLWVVRFSLSVSLFFFFLVHFLIDFFFFFFFFCLAPFFSGHPQISPKAQRLKTESRNPG